MRTIRQTCAAITPNNQFFLEQYTSYEVADHLGVPVLATTPHTRDARCVLPYSTCMSKCDA